MTDRITRLGPACLLALAIVVLAVAGMRGGGFHPAKARSNTPGLEAACREVNDWIRGSGRFDAVIDLDAATRDTRRPSRLSAAADCGDHLNPCPYGYNFMADAVDLALFGRWSLHSAG